VALDVRIAGLPPRSLVVEAVRTVKTTANRSTSASKTIAAIALKSWPRIVVFIFVPLSSLAA
jgi:hypothetical protein